MNDDYFDRLGLPRRFAVDAATLERAYLAHSRVIHPDYHLSGPSAELGASLELSAAVNDAYNTLRDPFARAEHLLSLEGEPTATDRKDVPPAFLMEVMELREQLEVSRRNTAETDRLAADFAARYNALLGTVGDLFHRIEIATAPDRASLLKQVRATLNAAKYVRGLIRDLNSD